jgi:hypothetical protein
MISATNAVLYATMATTSAMNSGETYVPTKLKPDSFGDVSPSRPRWGM